MYRTFAVLSLVAPLAALAFALGAPAPAALRWAVAAGVGSTVTRSLLKLSQERRRAAGEVRGYALLDVAQTLGRLCDRRGRGRGGARRCGPAAGARA